MAALPVDSDEGRAYIREMNYCVEFAECNRRRMAAIVDDIFTEVGGTVTTKIHDVKHNYARPEEHEGKRLFVHRKGATFAGEGVHGLIPGSQGTSSYLVHGLGNPKAFMSCSHGAGRVLGRKQAIESLDFERERRVLDGQGIIHSLNTEKDLQEAPSAYKNIDTVMEQQKDLAEIAVKFRPLAVIKG